VIDKKIVACCQANAWNSSELISTWIQRIWKQRFYFEQKERTLLIIDRATMHKKEAIIKELDACITDVIFIPAGQTSIL
jgi:hypothetical protein